MRFKAFKVTLVAFSLLAVGFFVFAQGNVIDSTTSVGSINSSSESDNYRIAPGEFLPISIKLVNFGSVKRVDVIIEYKILDSNNNEVYSENETVAVETTASFIKRLQIPYTIKPGLYRAVSRLNYQDQEQPAESSFPFMVEEKIGGVFKGDLILYSVSIVLIILIIFSFVIVINRRKLGKPVLFDYSDKSKEQRIYYEILSDIISQMRLRIGEDALEIAKDIPDLKINSETGKVLNIEKEPAKIIASLVSRYEQLSGRRISFGLRQK